MGIESIFDSFVTSISGLYLLQSAIKSNSDSELKKLAEQANTLDSLPDLKELPSSIQQDWGQALQFSLLLLENGLNCKT